MRSDNPWLIDPVQVHESSQHESTCIVDVSDAALYAQGHIPSAKLLPWQAIMHQGPPSPGLLPNAQQIEAILAHLGHTCTTHYLVYDHEGGGWAGRFLWLLESIGHRHKSYINGGKLAWELAGLPLARGTVAQTNGHPAQQPATHFSIDPRTSVSAEELLHALTGSVSPIIWDARSAGEYTGQMRTAARNGHIPGAIHCEWTQLMDASDGHRIRPDACDYLAGMGLTADQPIVTHCQSHHRSGFTYLVGKSLGFNIRAYAGSWCEWGNRYDTPITCE